MQFIADKFALFYNILLFVYFAYIVFIKVYVLTMKQFSYNIDVYNFRINNIVPASAIEQTPRRIYFLRNTGG